MKQPAPKIAIVAEFLTVMGGAENVVLALHNAFPEAHIYTALYEPDKLVPEFKTMDIRTTWLQKIPRPLRFTHKLFPTLQVKAFRGLDLSDYDIILTSAYLNANQVRKTRDDQLLISYCHTPARYYWSHYDQYRKQPGFGKLLDPFVRLLMPLFVPHQRKLDFEAAQKVDLFIANSTETQRRIKKYYNRPSIVIHPPVATTKFTPEKNRGDYYVTLGRQLPYKRYDLVVAAAAKLGVPLKVFGNGPAHDQLVKLAGPTVSFHTDRFGDASDEELEKALGGARGMIYAAEEDFGIVQAEALAAGAPVIAYGKGGTLDIVEDMESGVLFYQQTVGAVVDAIKRAEQVDFLPATLNRKARRFDEKLFDTKIKKVVYDSIPLKKTS